MTSSDPAPAPTRVVAATFFWRPFDHLGRGVLDLLQTSRQVLALLLVTLFVMLRPRGARARGIGPLVRTQIDRAGRQLLAMTGFAAIGLGLIVVGQTIALLIRVGAGDFIGTAVVSSVVRELGPFAAAMLVLARVGPAHVVELGSARAREEMRAIEAEGIDPIHQLVVPRVLGTTVGVFALTIYFLVLALTAGFVAAFGQNLPLTAAEYGRQLVASLGWNDFLLLTLKPCAYGLIIAAVTCHQGLVRPLPVADFSAVAVTARALVQSVFACIACDLGFIAVSFIR